MPINFHCGRNFRKALNLYIWALQRGDHCSHVARFARERAMGRA